MAFKKAVRKIAGAFSKKSTKKKSMSTRGLIYLLRHAAINEARICPNRNILLYGRKFLTTYPEQTIAGKKRTKYKVGVGASLFESPVCISIELCPTGKNVSETGSKMLASAKLGFNPGVVIVVPQGVWRKKRELDRFKTITGTSWADFLLEKIESHAKEKGYAEVRIPLPETLYYYKDPAALMNNVEDVRVNMRHLFSKVALGNGYEKKESYYVKQLK